MKFVEVYLWDLIPNIMQDKNDLGFCGGDDLMEFVDLGGVEI